MRVHCLKVRMNDGRIISVQLGKWFPVNVEDKSLPFNELNDAVYNGNVVDMNDDVEKYIIASYGLFGTGEYIIRNVKLADEFIIFDDKKNEASVVPYEPLNDTSCISDDDIKEMIQSVYVKLSDSSIMEEIKQDIIEELYIRYKDAEELEKKVKIGSQNESEIGKIAERVVAIVLAYKYEKEINSNKGVM